MHAYPSRNQEARVVRQPVELPGPLLIGPADPLIAHLAPPRCRAEKPRRQGTAPCRAEQIFEVLTDRTSITQVMFGGQQRFKRGSLVGRLADFAKFKGPQR